MRILFLQLENDVLNLLSQFDDNPPEKDEGKHEFT